MDGDARLALWVEGEPNDAGDWRVWIETNGDPIVRDDDIVDALIANGVDMDAARNAVEEGRFSGL